MKLLPRQLKGWPRNLVLIVGFEDESGLSRICFDTPSHDLLQALHVIRLIVDSANEFNAGRLEVEE
jgi:hypothetical protein